jgi:hypothetical protein
MHRGYAAWVTRCPRVEKIERLRTSHLDDDDPVGAGA